MADLAKLEESTMTTNAEPVIDMSPRAIAARLDEVRRLYRLVMYLRRFARPPVPPSE